MIINIYNPQLPIQFCINNQAMKIEPCYTACLAQGAYFIESEGEAAVIDPLRDTSLYLDLARQRGAQIKYIFETHFHADFVSGHQDLARATGATIVYGPTSMKTGFACYVGKDQEEFVVGNIRLRLLHTPGHTLESSCFLLINEDGKQEALFSGDTLFIGDVGRPDLAQKVIPDLTPEKLASMLFDSLRNQIMPLDDELTIYPGHGAGSACGKRMSNETQDTLGHQKKTNYALDPQLTREQFVTAVLTGLTPPPAYFPQNVLLNIHGSAQLDKVVQRALQPLSVENFESEVTKGAWIIDTRHPADFSEAFIPGSISVGLNGSFAVWVGTLVKPIEQPLLIVAEPGKEKEAMIRLARVGYDNVKGYLQGGFAAWKNAGKNTDFIENWSVEQLEQALGGGDQVLLDVRKASEYESQHAVGAANKPLDYFEDHLSWFNPATHYLVHCASGYRSVMFISCMKRHGFHHVTNIPDGFQGIKKSMKIPLTNFQEALTDL